MNRKDIDIKKVLLSKPQGLFELVVLIILMTLFFILNFGMNMSIEAPLFESVMISLLPTLTTSWATFSLIRLMRYRNKYTK